jgi:hypothetical protein
MEGVVAFSLHVLSYLGTVRRRWLLNDHLGGHQATMAEFDANVACDGKRRSGGLALVSGLM